MRTDTPGGVPMAAKCSCERRPIWGHHARVPIVDDALDLVGAPDRPPYLAGVTTKRNPKCAKHRGIPLRPAVFVNEAAYWSMYT